MRERTTLSKYEDAKKMVEDAGLIVDGTNWSEKNGWLDVHYGKIAHLLAEVKRMQYWDEEMDRVIAHLAQHNWASSDGDVHEIVEYVLTEVERLREALAYTASLLTCRMEGDDIPLVHIREYALDVVDMTVDEAMATTHLMGDEEE